MAAPYVRHATDGVAVPLDGLAGSLIAVFDNVLLGLGWSKPFSGINKAVYRAPSGHRRYLRVDDSFGMYARLRMYDSMSDVDTGTNPVPLDTQISGGSYFVKSSAATSATRDWTMFVADSYFYFRSYYGTSTEQGTGMFFGDFDSVVAGDLYNSALIAGNSTSYTANEMTARNLPTLGYGTALGEFVAGSYSGAVGSTIMAKHDAAISGGSFIGGDGLRSFPNAPDGKVYTGPIVIHEAPGVLRGTLPGAIALLHRYIDVGHSDYTIFDGSGDLAGRRFMCMSYYSSARIYHEIPPGYLM